MREAVVGLVELPLNAAQSAVGQTPGLRPHPRNEFPAFLDRHFRRRVVWLAEGIVKGFHQVNALPAEHDGFALVQSQHHHGSPTRMRAESHCGIFHLSLRAEKRGS